MLKVTGHTDDPSKYNSDLAESKMKWGGCILTFACKCGAILYGSPCVCSMIGTCPECGYENGSHLFNIKFGENKLFLQKFKQEEFLAMQKEKQQ